MATVIAANNLIDAQKMARDHPETFDAPDAGEISALSAGRHVKISNGNERFWVQLVGVRPDEQDPFETVLVGRVDNCLVATSDYTLDDHIEFRGRHVYTC